MRKAIIVVCGLIMLLYGAGGILLPVFGYIYAREWTKVVFTLGFPFFPVFYLPFTGWLLVTGGGLLWQRKWAWYSVQTLWVFLLCTGVLALVSFNLLFFAFKTVIGGAQLCGLGNLVLGLALVLIPLGGLAFFARTRELFTVAVVEENPWSVLPPVSDDRWSKW